MISSCAIQQHCYFLFLKEAVICGLDYCFHMQVLLFILKLITGANRAHYLMHTILELKVLLKFSRKQMITLCYKRTLAEWHSKC